jgi:phospholipase/carboxylesterase
VLKVLGLHGSSGHPESIERFVRELRFPLDASCPKGPFADGAGFTFFRRDADFGIPADDLLDLARNSLTPGGLLADYVNDTLLLVGFSSGAIFATALLAVSPACFAGAILLRPQPIREDFAFPELSLKPILIISGAHDVRRQPWHAAQLSDQLSDAHASVTHHVLDVGHGIASDGSDHSLASAWLATHFGLAALDEA